MKRQKGAKPSQEKGPVGPALLPKGPRADPLGSQDFYGEAERLRLRGEPFAVVTVVRVQPPTSGKPGDKAIVTADGRVRGWVGGSCVEDVVLREAQASLRDGQHRLIRLAPGTENERVGLFFHPMTCFSGGAMEVYIEPNRPSPELFVFGASPTAVALARLGEAAGFRVTILARAAESVPAGGWTIARDFKALSAVRPALTNAVIATHGTFDDEALDWCLQHNPAYIGLLASRRRFAAIRERLEKKGVSKEALDRIHAPAGLDLNAKTPEEVSVSILAEIVQVQRASERPASIFSQAPQSSCCHS